MDTDTGTKFSTLVAPPVLVDFLVASTISDHVNRAVVKRHMGITFSTYLGACATKVLAQGHLGGYVALLKTVWPYMTSWLQQPLAASRICRPAMRRAIRSI